MKKQNEKTQRKLSLKKIRIINVTSLRKIKGGDGSDGGNNTGDLGQNTSIQSLNIINNF
ncbi:hypothetical protein ODZ84_19135 [Chryseobacterium fluminis]|uniref:hypothetical protein n=1 Tax=Chryseobacterium fluminis TaxID=2983606 RepID=UPI00225BD5AE|nr:hypothetical protein [Chryseobacterium sp. MMS21-Ot14]UZT97281.1 hypothetical protein ODZ84_19135 [Chryseobacterium sp. MMS21-Ot14]